MKSKQNEENAFLAALSRFEKCLETPVVPGELPVWLKSARAASKKANELFRRQIKESHNEMLTTIARQDSELVQRVEDMKDADQELLMRWADVQSELERLCSIAERTEPHEAKLDEHVDQFTKKAIALVIELKKQETALTTWYMEAFYRDRGVAD